MRKLKKGIAVLSLVVGVLAINVYPTFAAVDPTVSDAVGGWDEDTGYFINAEAYSKAMKIFYCVLHHLSTKVKENGRIMMDSLITARMDGPRGKESIIIPERGWRIPTVTF